MSGVCYVRHECDTGRCVCVSQVSSEAHPDTLSDAQTFTIGVVPQIPGMPQLSVGADLQVTVRDNQYRLEF